MVAQHDAYIGRQIGNYRITKKLASGGFGSVYLAQHLILSERLSVIKLLHSLHLDSEQESASFLREAQFLEKLKHPYILPILDVGLLSEPGQNVPYIIADYAPNASLRQRIESYPLKPFPLAQATTILTQVGMALQHAHQQNIIHRDVKPENILFNAKDEALLADFGIATALQTGSVKFTRVIGTPSYMAPEQFQGMVSKETDQYALACIAYELFTGYRPFAAPDTAAMMYKQMNELPAPPRQINPQLPLHIEQAILRGMTKDRTLRFPSVAAFIAALSSHQTQPSAHQHALQPIMRPPQLPSQGLRTPYNGSASVHPSQQAYDHTQQAMALNSYSQYDALTSASKRSAGLNYLLPLVISLFLLPTFPIVHLVYWLVMRNQFDVRTNRFVRFHFIQSSLLYLWADISILLALGVLGIVNDRAIKFKAACASSAAGTCKSFESINGIFMILFLLALAMLLFYLIQWLRGMLSAFFGKYVKLPLVGKRAETQANKRPG